MRILMLNDDFPPKGFGGAAVVAFRLARGLQNNGHEVTILTTVRNKTEEGNTKYSGLNIFNIYASYHERWRAYVSLYNPQTVRKIAAIIQQVKPDIIHAHNIHQYLSYASLKAAKKSGAKVFLTIHDVMPFHYGKLTTKTYLQPHDTSVRTVFNYRVSWLDNLRTAGKRYNPFRNILIRNYLRHADKIFSVSNALRQALAQNKITNAVTLYNGINPAEWQLEEKAVQDYKRKHNLNNLKLILFGGRISAAKGSVQIITTLRFIKEKMPACKLVIFGNNNQDKQALLRLAQTLGVERDLHFAGKIPLERLKYLCHAVDVVVVPSVCFDSFPTVNLEAMTSKKPVVGTYFGGTPEIIQDGITGYVINPFDVNETAHKIIELLQDKEKAGQFGRAGYQRILTHFSLATQLRETLSWYCKG